MDCHHIHTCLLPVEMLVENKATWEVRVHVSLRYMNGTLWESNDVMTDKWWKQMISTDTTKSNSGL